MRNTLRTAALLLATASLALAGPKIAHDLEGLDPNETVDVIIQFVEPPDASDLSAVQNQGAALKRSLPAIDGALFELPAAALNALENNPRIKYVSPDREINPTLDYAQSTIGADIVHSYGFTGAGVGVAVIDSGVESHGDLSSQVAYSEYFLELESGTNDPFGHGTHVAGIISSNGQRSSGAFEGMAPGASIINLRVLDSQGSGLESNMIAAIDRAITLKDTHNIRVMNLSLGRPVFESYTLDPLCQAVQRAWEAGIVVVAAAGNMGRDNSFENEGYGTIISPANHPAVITVGAMKTMGTLSRADDLVASYSSKGPTVVDHVVKPDIVAPGNRTISLLSAAAWIDDVYESTQISTQLYKNGADRVSDYYFRLSGTSMATPMVSAAAALLLEQDPTMNPDQVKARLMRNATTEFPVSSDYTDPNTLETFTSYYDVFTVGAGYLDIQAAINDVEPIDPTFSAESPKVEFDPTTYDVTMLTDQSLLWGRSLIWGRSEAWATSLIWGKDSPYANSIIWGRVVLPATDLLADGDQ